MNCKMSHPSFKPPPPPLQSHLWLFWSDFRGSGKLHRILWSFASICESCRGARRGGEGGGHRCCAEREFAQRCGVIPQPSTLPPCQPLSQPAKQPACFPERWHRLAGTADPSLPPTPAAGSVSQSWPRLLTFAAGLADLSQMATS